MLSLWKTLIFHKVEYDLKGHERSHEAWLTQFFLPILFLSTDFDKDFFEYLHYGNANVS